MKIPFSIFILIASSLVSVLAQADIYRCKNAAGQLLSSDRPIPECSQTTMRVYDTKGVLKKTITPPLSEEEKKRIARDLEEKKLQQLAEQERQKEERFLRVHYKSEADIEASRKKLLDGVVERKRLAEEQLLSLKQTIKQLKQEQQASVASSTYSSLNARINEISKLVLKNEASIRVHEQEALRINQEHDETVKRYRAIVSSSVGK
jgi:vacuolar-type H+-ATPase subunit E/Vma4